MKILLATYFTIPQEIGGLWPFISELKVGLEQKGYSVDLLGRTADGSGYTLYNKDNVIHTADILPFVQRQLNDSLKNLPTGNHELQRYGLELAASAFGLSSYDVIHCQDVIAGLALSRVKPPNTPLITSVHGSLPLACMHNLKKMNPRLTALECKKNPVYQYNMALEYAGLKRSNLIHTSSLWFRKRLHEEYDVPFIKMKTIPYGLNRYENSSKKNKHTRKNASHKKVITYTGRLTTIKGIPFLIDALHELKKTRNDWTCWMVGEGDILEDSIAQTQRLKLTEDITFYGKRNDVFSLLKKSDIFVLPSLQDNQPYSLMEAQFSGLPSVVTSTGGLPEMVIHGLTGFVVPPADHQALSTALQRLLEQDDLRSKQGREAKAFAEKTWCFEKMINDIITLYKKMPLK